MARKLREVSTSRPARMRIRGPKLLARKYERPAQIGSLFLADAYRVDHSRSLWEVHESSPEADAALKIALRPEWILVTPRNSGVFLHRDEANRDVFLLAASSVRRIIPWTTGDESVKMKGSRVLVRPDEVKQRTSTALIVAPEAWTKRPVTGVVAEVGDGVRDSDIVVGTRVLYGIHAGTALTVNGVDHMILEEAQVLATLGDEEEVTL